MTISFRTIIPSDNAELASIIRGSLEAFGLNIPGTVYTDPTTDHLYELFQAWGSIYIVGMENNKMLGGCGIYPTKGLPPGHAELVKLYLRDEARGKGIGRNLMLECISWAKTMGYTHLYLETLTELSAAVSLYQSLGFQNLSAPLGESGHHACQIWMSLELTEAQVSMFDIDSSLYQQSLIIRQDVFIREQAIDPALELEHENESLYFLVTFKDKPVSTGRLRVVGNKIKFERIATLESSRHQGLGKILMQAMTRLALDKHPEKIPFMNAQLSAAGFYEKLGWQKQGDIFTEAGIPHIAMILPRSVAR